MPRITEAGLVRTTEAQYNTRALDVFRAGLGSDMQTGADTVQGLIARAMALMLSAIDAEVLYNIGGFNPATMVGEQLDNLAVGFQLTRRAATRSTGTVTLSGANGTVIPAESEVRTDSGDIFSTDTEVTIPSSGSIDVDITAEEYGVVQANADTITIIVDARPGWTGVTNAAAITPGRNREKDSVFRARIEEARDRNGFGSLAAIRGRLLDVDGVTHADVLENRTNAEATTRGITIAAGGIAPIVEGGTDADVAEAIYLGSVTGQVFSGTTSEDHAPTEAPTDTVTIRFTRATEVEAQIALTITGSVNFPGDGLSQIRANLLEFWEGSFEAGSFQSTPVGVGVLPDSDLMRVVILQTPGATITSLELQLKSDSSEITSVDADERLSLESNDINITLNT